MSWTARFYAFYGVQPSKNELARSCKIVQDLSARLAWHVHTICPFSCTILTQSCTNSCKILQKKKCKKLQTSFLQHLSQNLAPFLARYVQDCARIVQKKGHIACTCQASLACKILAQSCMILQVHFCWE